MAKELVSTEIALIVPELPPDLSRMLPYKVREPAVFPKRLLPKPLPLQLTLELLFHNGMYMGYAYLFMGSTSFALYDNVKELLSQTLFNLYAKEGKTKKDIGREAFLKRAWEWRAEYGGTIVKQLRKMGSSCDWERERFTMDDGCNRAVVRVFKNLYDKGLIYRGNRIINWCPDCKTALSDAEVEYESQDSHLWHVRYDAPDKSYSITVATTRPETMLGDTAIAVHPEDPRYKDIIGKTVVLPLVNREIPIVGDEYCEMEFGTGAVKITPAHDPNDFEVGKRHNLPVLRVFTDDGHVNEEGGKYCGQDRFECRKNIVKDLEESGNLVKIEDYTHNVGTCYRCHTTIETIVSKQWFVDMKPLAGPAIDMVRSGKVRFVPERFDKPFYNWMENIRDWCISRQLWWGHRIPVYYCDDCGGTFCEETAPEKCPHCGGKLRQDEDVLDTWFSSGLWPFSTLGWPDETEELKYFYPTDTLVTGYDIITFWISRMITFAAEVMKEEPFKTVYVHGLVRDGLGRKMSKSLGNGIDPLDIIERYGADSLRFSLVTGNAAGNDMRFYTEKVEAARNFCNKVYNAARFVLMNIDENTTPQFDESKLSIIDKWILAQLDRTIREVTAHLDAYDLNLAAEKIYDFIWGTLCDWYIELSKPSLYSDDAEEKVRVSSVLLYVLSTSMKLLHPFMPFITEELYQRLPGHEETIMLCDWPKASDALRFEAEEAATETLKDVVRAIRNVRAERKVPVGLKIRAKLVVPDPKAFGAVEKLLTKLIGAESVEITDARGDVQKTDVHLVCEGAEAYIPLASLVDLDEERARIEKEIERVKGEVTRAEGKLSNEKFVAKAPEAVVNEERRKLEAAKEMLARLLERRSDLE